MKHFKKRTFLTTAVIVGVFAVGGAAFAFTQRHMNSASDKKINTEINQEKALITSINSQLTKAIDSNGYISANLTKGQLAQFQKQLNSIKDSYIDFHIKKYDLKSQIKVVKIDKQKVEQKLSDIESKFEVQNKVNALFVSTVIEGTQVSKSAIADKVVSSDVTDVKMDLDALNDRSQWFETLSELIGNASNQLSQIDKANMLVSKLFKDGKVVDGVSRNKYNKAKSVVDKVQNGSIKKDLTFKLNQVLGHVKNNEEKVQTEKVAEKVSNSKSSHSGGDASSSSQTTISSYSAPKSTSTSTSHSSSSGGSSSSSYTPTKKTYTAPAPKSTYTPPAPKSTYTPPAPKPAPAKTTTSSSPKPGTKATNYKQTGSGTTSTGVNYTTGTFTLP